MLPQAKEEYEKQQRLDGAQISTEQRAKIMGLASVFPRLWNEPKTLDRDRKRMARLLVEDVTLRREQEVLVQIRFNGSSPPGQKRPCCSGPYFMRLGRCLGRGCLVATLLLAPGSTLGSVTPAAVSNACTSARGWSSTLTTPATSTAQ